MLRLALFLALVAPALQAVSPPPCSSPEHRQFDFWLGDWRVHTPDGKFAGLNRIALEYGSCVIHERYANGRNYSGESLNIYDPSRQVWHQTWVDSSGLLLTLEGKWNGKQMILEGMSPGPKGDLVKQRITWTPNTDGTLRQLWEAADGKGGWTVVFDGIYTRG